MRALEREVVDAVWQAVEPLLPPRPEDRHPLGCHRPWISDRICFQGILIRLVTGCSWVDVEAIMEHRVSDTTLRARRSAWTKAGVFDRLEEEALAAYDRIVGLDLSECAVDTSLHKAPRGGEATGPNPCDRRKSGGKWSLVTEAEGIPIGWVLAGANCQDISLLQATLAAADARGLLEEVEAIFLDRGYDAHWVRQRFTDLGIEAEVARRRSPRKNAPARRPKRVPLGRRWTVERTNAWLANFGQLRRNTDRRLAHRAAQFALALVFLITAKLIDWRDRWSPR